MVYSGTATKEVIIAYFKYILQKLPPKTIIIVDNASVHKSKELKELFRLHDVILEFLPPYSPELNPIEKLWGLLKRTLRNYFDYSLSLFENLCKCLNDLTGELKSVNVF